MDANRFFRRKVPWNSSFPLTKSSEYGVYQMRVPKMFCVTLQYVCVYVCAEIGERAALDFWAFSSSLHFFEQGNYRNERNFYVFLSFRKLLSSTLCANENIFRWICGGSLCRQCVKCFPFPDISGKFLLPLFLWLHYIILPTLLFIALFVLLSYARTPPLRILCFFLLAFVFRWIHATHIKSVNWICFMKKHTERECESAKVALQCN